jgi:hypothetical protein
MWLLRRKVSFFSLRGRAISLAFSGISYLDGPLAVLFFCVGAHTWIGPLVEPVPPARGSPLCENLSHVRATFF